MALPGHSQPRRAEVSGSEVKVNPGIAGKATQRARPTDPESAACKRHCLSREHCPSGLAGAGPRDKAGQGPNRRDSLSATPRPGLIPSSQTHW